MEHFVLDRGWWTLIPSAFGGGILALCFIIVGPLIRLIILLLLLVLLLLFSERSSRPCVLLQIGERRGASHEPRGMSSRIDRMPSVDELKSALPCPRVLLLGPNEHPSVARPRNA